MCAVEWKKLGEVMQIVRGASPRPINNYLTTDINGVNWIKIGDVSVNDKYITKAKEKITKEGASRSRYLKPGDFILSNSMSFGRPYILKTDGCIHDGWIAMSNFNEYLISGYLYEVLSSNEVQQYWKMKANNGGAMINLNSDIVRETLIPIPSLAKQQEIVSHLDTFTTLISNLESELDMRRKQYEHYRNQLLDFEGVEGVEWKKTKDICTNICSGGTPLTSNQEYYNGTIPWLRTQEVDWGYVYDTKIKITQEAINNSSAKMIPVDCVIIAMYGATAAKCCINKIPLSTNQACCNLEINKDIASYKYVYYWFCKEYANLKAMGEGSQNNISGNKIKGYLIPILSLKTQQEIVEKLDAFENLIQSLEQEIKLRKQQYEYYREKLLTFEKE